MKFIHFDYLIYAAHRIASTSLRKRVRIATNSASQQPKSLMPYITCGILVQQQIYSFYLFIYYYTIPFHPFKQVHSESDWDDVQRDGYRIEWNICTYICNVINAKYRLKIIPCKIRANGDTLCQLSTVTIPLAAGLLRSRQGSGSSCARRTSFVWEFGDCDWNWTRSRQSYQSQRINKWQ